ncbi:alanine--tRNA ligase-related protein, partial [Neisseria meningitidis]|nr:alanine--tRNA ligase-related protein [Neisseria meningitidis]
HGYKLGQKQAIFYKLVPDLVKAMGDAYPELKEKQTQIMEALRAEESRFGETLEKGMGLFNQVYNELKFNQIFDLLAKEFKVTPVEDIDLDMFSTRNFVGRSAEIPYISNQHPNVDYPAPMGNVNEKIYAMPVRLTDGRIGINIFPTDETARLILSN